MTAERFYPIQAHVLVLSIPVLASFVDCGETLLKLDRSHQIDRAAQRSSKLPRMEAIDDIELDETTHKVLSAMATQPWSFLHLPHFFTCHRLTISGLYLPQLLSLPSPSQSRTEECHTQ